MAIIGPLTLESKETKVSFEFC